MKGQNQVQGINHSAHSAFCMTEWINNKSYLFIHNKWSYNLT